LFSVVAKQFIINALRLNGQDVGDAEMLTAYPTHMHGQSTNSRCSTSDQGIPNP
jgi:hypothetical protein